MCAIPFTDREMKAAWRNLSKAAKPGVGERENPHRLLLFYAVECGLKAVWLKRQCRTLFDGDSIKGTGHNLHQILKCLRVDPKLLPPEDFVLGQVNSKLGQVKGDQVLLDRKGKFGDLHQVWRYGGACESPSDRDCELHLEKVLNWIQGELK